MKNILYMYINLSGCHLIIKFFPISDHVKLLRRLCPTVFPVLIGCPVIQRGKEDTCLWGSLVLIHVCVFMRTYLKITI